MTDNYFSPERVKTRLLQNHALRRLSALRRDVRHTLTQMDDADLARLERDARAYYKLPQEYPQ